MKRMRMMTNKNEKKKGKTNLKAVNERKKKINGNEKIQKEG